MSFIGSHNDEAILAALITHTSVREAANEIGISEGTIYSRLKNDAFRKRYDELRAEILNQVTAGLQGKLAFAIDTIESIMSNPAVSPQTRLNAASELIRDCMRMTEQNDILIRLEAIEEAQNLR